MVRLAGFGMMLNPLSVQSARMGCFCCITREEISEIRRTDLWIFLERAIRYDAATHERSDRERPAAPATRAHRRRARGHRRTARARAHRARARDVCGDVVGALLVQVVEAPPRALPDRSALGAGRTG